jgi:flagellar hook-basal body complex protein FliE
MELRLTPVTVPLVARSAEAPRAVESGRPASFASVLTGALEAVSGAQNQAAALQREVQLENPNVSLEQTMVATQKAQIGFQATLHVRNRMVQAYSDIMNMQV